MRANVNQLKEKVDRILEAIQALARKENTDGDPPIVNEEHQTTPFHPPGFTPTNQKFRTAAMQFPIYGLSPGYTPSVVINPIENNQKTTQLQLLPHLLQYSMVVLRPMKPLEPPFPKWYNPNARCEYHGGAVGNSVEYCQALKTKVQELINSKWLTFKEDGPNVGNNPLPGHGDAVVNLIEEEINQYTKDDYVSTIEPCMENDRSFPRPLKILYRKENPKPTHSGKNAIIVQAPTFFPYENNKAVPWSYEVTSHLFNHQSGDSSKYQGTDVTNISGIGGMTRSGRVYTPEQLREKEGHGEKGKGVVYHAIKGPEICKKTVPTEEANEFLKFIKQNEYKAHVTHDITVDQFDGVVGNIIASSSLSFSDVELPAEGMEHNKTLHISPSTMVVKMFDGSRRQVVGEIDLPIQIEPHNFGITFQVMDIKSAYSCLLGRPWIHAAGAVTSTLHQKLKFIVNNNLVIISGEEDMIVSHLSSTGYIEEAEEAIETSFQALEIVNVVFMDEEFRLKEPKLSTTSLKSTKSMLEGGAFVKFGKLIEIPEKKDKYGLRYIPTKADQENVVKEK
ncbi:uncharacterized protein [Cicer arietinum]|uniref:Uncharacterized protein LOC101504558 n=1 Tax=Cicer arietinum TaxID=3827 RepID=A0A3Q7Y8F8_CICAR|nr:uncharacterized protein LOC101504558 [Cicer arietinum]